MRTFNPVTILTDERQVTITIAAKGSWATRIVLFIGQLVLLTGLVFAIQESIMLLLLLVLVLEFWLLLLVCWNLFGKEVMTISADAFTCRHYYGFFHAPAAAKEAGKALCCRVVSSEEDRGQVLQQLQFESEDEDGMPYVVYRVTLLVREADARMILAQVLHFWPEPTADDEDDPILYLL